MTEKQANTLFLIGYAILISGAILHILGIGILINTFFRVKILPRSTDRRIRRLNSQHFIIVACFIITAYLMYKHHSAWALPLLIAGVIDFYLTFRYPKVEDNDDDSREQEQNG